MVNSIGAAHNTKFIDEGNVYRLIANSKLSKAEEFAEWVFDEVIPTVRKTGGYVNDAETFVKSWLPNADAKTQEMVLSMLNTVKHQDTIIGVQKPSVEFASAVGESKTALTIEAFAKCLQNERVDIGRNRLFKWLRDKKYIDGNNRPYQKYITAGLFQVKENVYYVGRYPHITTQPLITPKGQKKLYEEIRASFLKN